MGKLKPYNNGQWTESRFHSFICSALRSAWTKWGPKASCLRKARVSRGLYLCACCGHEVPASLPGVYKTGKKKGQRRRIKNALVDHIDPVVDPEVGFVNWQVYIERMFVEESKLQVLCKHCHDEKSKRERAARKKG